MFRNRLRPVFFRVTECLIATSGWIDTANEDIWACSSDVYALALIANCGCGQSKRLLSLQPYEDTGMVLVPQATLALTIGERIEFTREVDLYPCDVIEKGERAVVGRRDKCTGLVELYLEQHHIKMADTNNCLACMPHTDADLIGSIRPYRDSWTAKTFVNLSEYTQD